MFHLLFFSTLFIYSSAQCSYYQDFVVGQDYYIFNDEYPSNYTGGARCQWEGESPPGTNIVISCTLSMPSSPGCSLDRISLSEYSFYDYNSNLYCGNYAFTDASKGNKIYLQLLTAPNSPGGKFICTLVALQKEPVLPPKITDCNCGLRKQNRIVGGVESEVNEFPAMAGIFDSSIKELFCGATIISSSYVVTAAHCLTNRDYNQLGVIVGEHNLKTGSESNYTSVKRISRVKIHPNYDDNQQWNDIALVKTATPIQFNAGVSPICLPFRYTAYDFVNQRVLVLGWGTQQFSGAFSNVLLYTDLRVVSNNYCNASINDVVILSQICTFRSSHDACTGDSGGPVFWTDLYTDRLYLIGVISYGVGCASSFPSVNTRVTSYLNWIVRNTEDDVFCLI